MGQKNAVKVVKNRETVGQVSRAISLYMTYFSEPWKNKVEVIGNRENSRGNGLEVPGKYLVKGPYHSAEKGHFLINDYCRRTPL